MNVKKILCLLLVALMLLSIVACGNSDEPVDSGTADSAVEGELDQWGRPVQYDKLPADLRYDGTEVTLYMYRAEDFMVEELTGDIVDDEIFKRNQRVEDRLGVKLKYKYESGDTWDASNMTKNIAQDAMGGTQAYDMFALFAYNATASATAGYLAELHTLDYLELEADWYSWDFVNNMTIENRLYSTMGSATLSAYEYAMLLFCNNSVLEDRTDITGADLLQLVVDGGWTIDYMNELITNIGEVGSENVNDNLYGYSIQATAKTLDSWLYSAGVRLVDKDANNELALVVADNKQRDSDIYGKIYNLLYSNPSSYVDGVYTGGVSTPKLQGGDQGWLKHFKLGRSCFTGAWMMDAVDFYQAGVSYSILPYPKVDSDQTDYYVTPHDKHNVLAIPMFGKNTECSSAVMELLSKYAYDTVYPIYFEDTMRYRYFENDLGSQVYDIIMESMGIDFGTFYQNSLAEIKNEVIRNPLLNGEQVGGFTRAIDNGKKTYQHELDALKKNFLSQ